MIIKKEQRAQFNIMVPQADSLGAIGVIRSLGNAGYKVFATSTKSDALGLLSNYCFHSAVSPNYNEVQYIKWLRLFIKEHKIKAIIPSEGMLLALEPHFEEFSPLLPISTNKKVVYDCFCKVDVFDSFINSDNEKLKRNIPFTNIVTDENGPDWDKISTWPMPLYIKGDAFYSDTGMSAFVSRATSIDKAKEIYITQRPHYKKILIQGFFNGTKAAVNLFMKDGKLLAESMAYSPHENPYYGGLMSLRHTWWHEAMYQDAINRVKHLGWVGPAMFEYKYDPETDTFGFIELNARYWGFFNLEVIAGLDYPVIQLDDFFSLSTPDFPKRLTKHIAVRNTFPADFGYMYSKLKATEFSIADKTKTVLEFIYLFFNPFIKADLLYKDDRKLYFINMYRFFKAQTLSLKQKITRYFSKSKQD